MKRLIDLMNAIGKTYLHEANILYGGKTVHVVFKYLSRTEIPHTLDPPLLSLLVVPLVRELRSTRSCDFLNRGGGFIKGILSGVRCTKSLRVFFLHPAEVVRQKGHSIIAGG